MFVSGHRRTGSFGNSTAGAFNMNQIGGQPPQFDNYMLHHTTTAPGNLECSGADSEQGVTAFRSTSWAGPGGEGMMSNNGKGVLEKCLCYYFTLVPVRVQ